MGVWVAYRRVLLINGKLRETAKTTAFGGASRVKGATAKPAEQTALFVLGLPTARPITNIADCWFGFSGRDAQKR